MHVALLAGQIAIGATDGSTTVLEISESLYAMQKTEKANIMAMLDREVRLNFTAALSLFPPRLRPPPLPFTLLVRARHISHDVHGTGCCGAFIC